MRVRKQSGKASDAEGARLRVVIKKEERINMTGYGKVLLISMICVMFLCGCSTKKSESGETTSQTTEHNTDSTSATEDNKETESETVGASGEFTDDELIQMASDYYANIHDGNRPSHIAIENDDGTIVDIHLYEEGQDSIATLDWYYINRSTGTGYDFLGYEIDLTNTDTQE